MKDVDFRIVYEGGDADSHMIDMRELALSMLGAERIVSDGLVTLIHRRLPKRGERAPVVLKAQEPRSGSVELVQSFGSIYGLLNLGLPIAKELTSHFLAEWWKAVIARFSGRPDVSEAAITAMSDLSGQHLAARDLSDARRHEEVMAFIDLIRIAIAGQQRSIEQFASPVGASVEKALLFPGAARPVEIESAQADRIRDSVKLTWGPLEEITLRTEGFRFHTSGLSIENPERNGFLMARVRDPRFEEPENPYTEAAQKRAEVLVLGRKGYKEATLAGIEIVDFIREL